ncbi:hypothetical protein [Streptomyces noursei]|uniref:hypothetical protein n=1 Tax=Streptomyces noursei TaxID=1971 RepID=UPI001F36BCC0|nr:hypothetical protein [Streptomyces noursei]
MGDLLVGQGCALCGSGCCQLVLCGGFVGLGLADPAGDGGGVGAGVEGGPVLGEAPITFRDGPAGCAEVGLGCDVGALGLLHGVQRGLQAARGEDRRDPVVELAQDEGFPDVHGQGVVEGFAFRVLGGVAAAVVGVTVVEGALHLALAQGAADAAA